MGSNTTSISLDRLYTNFKSARKRYESPEIMGRKLWGLITECHLSTIGLSKASAAQKDIATRQFRNMARTWIHGDPKIAPSQVMINLLARGKYAEAVEYAEKQSALNTKAEQLVRSSSAKKAANAKAKSKNELIQLAIKDYKTNPRKFHSKNNAAEKLSKKYPGIAESTIRRHLRNLK